ncbi:MAG TPA: glycosyltransferase [Vicinamibacteria bacterium]|nr:glycosyltransferase [Vicinamibacteria bacterium]
MVLPEISVVIPARNEERLLPRLLDSIEVARGRYRQGAAAVEVIVADNISTDSTAEVARQRGCLLVTVDRRVIAAVRNGGGRAARGRYLAFVDADFQIHPDTFDVISETLDGGRYVGGATSVTMERFSLAIGVTYAAMLPLAWATKMDSGVVFCRREDFLAIGGYRETMRVAEDVRFLQDLRKLGRERGQSLVRATRARAIASTRKFDRYGDWHFLTNLFRSAYWLVFDRSTFRRFVEEYWYGDVRS